MMLQVARTRGGTVLSLVGNGTHALRRAKPELGVEFPNGPVRGSTLTETAHPDHHSSHLCVLFYGRRSCLKLIGHLQPEKLGKSQKEMPHVQLPPRILFADVHLG